MGTVLDVRRLVTEAQVFAATLAVVAVAVTLIVAGVAVLSGLGWSLVTAGGLIGSVAASAAVVLLHEGRPKP